MQTNKENIYFYLNEVTTKINAARNKIKYTKKELTIY